MSKEVGDFVREPFNKREKRLQRKCARAIKYVRVIGVYLWRGCVSSVHMYSVARTYQFA